MKEVKQHCFENCDYLNKNNIYDMQKIIEGIISVNRGIPVVINSKKERIDV